MARILVVDDEPVVGGMIAAILQIAGHGVVAVERAIEGLDRCRDGSFDLGLVDIRLPDMDGLELAKRILSKHPDIKIVLMTGGSEPLDEVYRRMAKSVGVSDVISKPFSQEDLVAVVEEVLRSELEKG